jgi:type II secretory pathway pseudopilin PulG
MENETNVAAGRAPVKRFFGAITIVLSLFGCLALGLLIAYGIFMSRARAEMVRSQEDQARAVREFQSSLEYQSSLVSAVPTQTSPYQPQQPQYVNPYSTPYGSSPPAMMGPVNSLSMPSQVPQSRIPQSTERMPGSALDAEVQRLAIELRYANSEKRERLNHQLLSKLTESFDARQKSHVSQLMKLQGEVQKTQELIEKREKLKSQIIERRIKELTGQLDELGWDPITKSGTDAPSTQSASSPSVPYGFPSSPYGQGPSTTLPPASYPYSSVNPNDISVPPQTTNSGAAPSDVTGIASNSTDPTSQSQTSQRSFITIGFRLKQLLKELADENAINQIPNPSRRAIQLQSSIDETRAVWDFEKLQFKNNLDVIDKEQRLVERQLENATEAIDIQKNLASKGAANKTDVSKAEDQRSEIERQLLQLSSRWANLKQSFDWMNEFEKASLNPQDKEVTTY